MSLFDERTHRRIYLGILGIYIVGLVFSKPVLSIATMILAANWLAEGRVAAKFKKAFTNPVALTFIIIYLLHVIGLLYTSDMTYGLNDLRVKLPLLVLPILLTNYHQLTRREMKGLMQCLILSVTVASLVDFAVYQRWILPDRDLSDIRQISIFMSHIRFSLVICLSIFALVSLYRKSSLLWRLIYVALIVWFMYFLLLLQSGTGYVVLLLVGMLALLSAAFRLRRMPVKLICIAGFLILPTFAVLYVTNCVQDYYTVHSSELESLPEFTAQGNPYQHDTTNLSLENGYYVWRNICITELEQAWNERSAYEFGGPDSRGYLIDGAVIRYMTSKGLKKDAVGVAALTDEDVKLIEAGVANAAEADKWGLRKRIDQIIFEFDIYANGGNPSGNSVTQRLEFWNAAWWLIKQNPVVGVGTGDVEQELRVAYSEIQSVLDEEHRLKSHNQFITTTVALGFLGMFLFLCLMIYPLFTINWREQGLYLSLFVTCLVSFLAEDTLETQVGATFFTFFSCLFLLATKKGADESAPS